MLLGSNFFVCMYSRVFSPFLSFICTNKNPVKSVYFGKIKLSKDMIQSQIIHKKKSYTISIHVSLYNESYC